MIKFLENRLGLVSAFRSSMSEKRPPMGIGYLRTIGFAALTVMTLQFLTGVALAFHYVPTTELAFDSIRAMEADIRYGALTRSLHHFGASAFVIFVVLHMARVFFTGAYKRPREFTWLTGVGLFLLVIGFGFTGYLLPWDQKAYFATKVGTEIAGDTPVIGAHLRDVLRGGESVGQPTLTRFYIIHVVLLPLGLLALLGGHFYLIQRHGVSAPKLPVGDEGPKGPTYFPHHTFREALVGVLVAGGLFWLSWEFRTPLEPLAEPSDTSYIPRPDWYFLGLFELLKLFQEDLTIGNYTISSRAIGTFWIPSILVTGLVLVPFFDRGKQRHWRKRWIMTPIGMLVCAAVVILTVMGWRDDPSGGAPTNLTATVTDGKVTLTWEDNCTDETGFVLEKKTGGAFEIAANPPADTTEHVETLPPNTVKISYRLRAITPSGESTNSNRVRIQEGKVTAVIDGLTLPFELGYTNIERHGYLLARRHKCMDCHNHSELSSDGTTLRVFGHINDELDTLRMDELDVEDIEGCLDVFAETPDDMPDFSILPKQDQLALATFVMKFLADQAAK